MTITYTSNLKLALPTTGTEAGTWGDVVNQQLTALLDQSVAGTVSLTSMTDANYTLTSGNGNAANEARYMAVTIPATLTLTAARNVIVPTSSKVYVFSNLSLGGFAVTVKTSGGTGVSVPNGATQLLYCDGVNVLFAVPLTRTSATGSAITPVGTSAQRDAAPLSGYFRFNTSTGSFEGYNGANWGAVGGGATGGGTDTVFVENDVVVTVPYTIGQSAYLSGVTVTLATPGVFTLANHGYVAEQVVHLSTTGALPTGLAVDTPYYVIATGLTASTFQLSATLNGTGIATSGTQSGVHSVGKIKNAETAGPIAIATGIPVTIPTGSTWSIVG